MWFLASNSKDMPLVMTHQVNSEKSQILSNAKPTPILLGKLVGRIPTSSQLYFFALRNLFLGPFETMLAGRRPKVVYTFSAAFAVEIWARLRQMTSTVWENNFGTLL